MFLKDSKTGAAPSTSGSSSKPESKASRVPSIISPDLKIVGDLNSSGDIQIDGTVEGDIDSRLLVVGEGARINGSVVAETIRISGTVNGEVKAKSVTLDKTARVIGDVVHEDLTMEAGAFLEGGVRRLNSSGATIAPIRPATANANGGGDSSYGGARETIA